METIAAPTRIFGDFGPYLTYNEAVKSDTAIRKGIANVPTPEQYANLVVLYNHIIVPLFTHFGKLPVSSMFRSVALNTAIGGAKTSAHMAGQAVDIDCDSMHTVSNKQVFEWVAANLDFDQLIYEDPNPVTGQPAWVHIAYKSPEQNRRQKLRMVWQKGKQVYQTIE